MGAVSGLLRSPRKECSFSPTPPQSSSGGAGRTQARERVCGLGKAAPPSSTEAAPRPTAPARGVRRPLLAAERTLPPQAFVHEAQIPAAAVAVLIVDFRPHRRLHGTGDGEPAVNRRQARGPWARNTPPQCAEVGPEGAGRGGLRQPTAGHLPALTEPPSGKPDRLRQGLPSVLLPPPRLISEGDFTAIFLYKHSLRTCKMFLHWPQHPLLIWQTLWYTLLAPSTSHAASVR